MVQPFVTAILNHTAAPSSSITKRLGFGRVVHEVEGLFGWQRRGASWNTVLLLAVATTEEMNHNNTNDGCVIVLKDIILLRLPRPSCAPSGIEPI